MMYTEIKENKRKYIGIKPKDLKEFTKILLHILEKEVGFKSSHNQGLFQKNGLSLSASFGTEVVLGFKDGVLLKITDDVENAEVIFVSFSGADLKYTVSFKNYSIYDFIFGALRRSWEEKEYKENLIRYITRVNLYL